MNNKNSKLFVQGARSETAFGTNTQDPLDDVKRPTTKPSSARFSESLMTPGQTPIIYDLNGANIELQVNNMIIKTHETYVSKFAYLNQLIEKARLANPQADIINIAIAGDNKLEDDFLNTFKIMSASSIEKCGTSETEFLVSAVRISSEYGYPALCAFCVDKLEKSTTDPMIQQLLVARELESIRQSLKELERVYRELSEHVDPYWRIAKAQELRQQAGFSESKSNGTSPCLCILLLIIFCFICASGA
ncbi:hypothetical protein RSOLAG22IIIB_01289 [Rhizoctonia solani]|uniref:BTB domain-containing protein n=1 Tax=Rhizoctonia solani TaxID=456999 RepID=A0A0K6G564_9AGAM|nr:hypothetical protein RSOLAG22IIIB_01289 [Rhizoctonia solani]